MLITERLQAAYRGKASARLEAGSSNAAMDRLNAARDAGGGKVMTILPRGIGWASGKRAVEA